MSSVIPKWADDKAGRVISMFPQGDTERIDRELLHGAFAAALVQERERCAKVAEAEAVDLKNSGAWGDLHLGAGMVAAAIRKGTA